MVTKWNHLRRLIELASSRATGGIIWGGSFTRYFVQVTLICKRDIVKIYEQDRPISKRFHKYLIDQNLRCNFTLQTV